MAFTYSLSTDAGKVRLELGDTVDATVSPGQGVRPNGANLTDDEIAYLLAQEENHVMKAVARGCEMLARQWAAAVDLSIGPRSERFDTVSAKWAARAEALRTQYGTTVGASDRPQSFSVAFKRDDEGYRVILPSLTIPYTTTDTDL